MIPARQRFSFPDYVAIEEVARIKHEFLDGHVWAMAGGSPEHGAIAANVIALLGTQLRARQCRVFTSDVRVRVPATGLATYPDVSVVCGRMQTDPQDPSGSTVLNPVVVVEVLSPSTEAYDRGEKLAHYQQMPALREIVLIAHDEQRVEIWHRQDDRWTLRTVGSDGTASLESIGCELPLAEIYRNPLG
jgi:Uma2 family endonuclease